MAWNKSSVGSAWREKAFYTDPDERLHTADPSHTEKSEDPNITWDAPPAVENQPEYLYAQDLLNGDWVADNAGMVIDTTPVDHQDGGDFAATAPGAETINANAATSGRSYGADHADTYAPPLVQDYTTQYLSPRFEGFGSPGQNPLTVTRGINSLPENNPDGFRRGWVEQTFVDRKLQAPAGRVHDRRLLTPNTAYSMSDQPPVGGTSGNPFTGLARAFSTIAQTPMIRREPVSMSDSITTDGSEQTYDESPGDWMAG
jgi:hypothetical protein